MIKQIQVLDEVCNTLEIDVIGHVGEAYCVTIWQSKVDLQGNFNNRLVRKIKDAYPDCVSTISESGYVKTTFEVNEVLIEITLT